MSTGMQAETRMSATAGGGRAASVSAFGVQFPAGLKVGFWVCIVIAVAVVIRRAAVLADGNTQGPTAALDSYFASHAALTYTHIFCALALVAVLPLLFSRRMSGSAAVERAFFVLGGVVGATAYAMSVDAVGGWVERSAVLFFNTLFLVALAMAFRFAQQGERVRKERWVLRAVAVLLGIATTRPVMGVFFATSRLTHMTPRQFFGIAFWIGFSFNAVVMELWLRRRNLTEERIGA